MAEKFKVVIAPKKGTPFMLLVGAMSVPDHGDAFGVFAISAGKGLAQKMCAVTEPRPSLQYASEDMALIAERHRRLGAKLGACYDERCYKGLKDMRLRTLDDKVARAIRDDWSEGCRDISDGGTYSDILATAFTRIAAALE